MSKLDNPHPFDEWLKSRKISRSQASKQIGRSTSCVGRWIKGIRHPSPVDQELVARFTKGAIPPAVWHRQAVEAVPTSFAEADAA